MTAILGVAHAMTAGAQTAVLADQPVFVNADVPGNLALTLSVEFPTAISVANINGYSDSSQYLGYFDPLKCYTYIYNSTTPASSYFQPIALASNGTTSHQCSGYWSGNFMNWATMQTIDPFRWALTGGYRSLDSTSQTIVEKAWGPANQGSASGNFNYRGTSQGTANLLSSSLVAGVTPFTTWTSFNMGIWGNGNTMVFSGTGSGYQTSTSSSTVSDLTNTLSSVVPANAYRVYVRVDVCDATTALGTAGLESNCVQYPPSPALGPYHYKPEGLMQQYSSKIRFSAFSYLNGSGMTQQGAVLREPMDYIGPTHPMPLSTTVVTNPKPEWDAISGIMYSNPDPVLALASGVTSSGVMNFLNKFGENAKSYMTYDNVSELYYAAVRYYENKGNVSQWYSGATAAQLDGFPAAAIWTDPIAYSCQKNFILGIGDNHTWYDYNVGGGTITGGRSKPTTVGSDTFNQAATWTTNLQTIQGITPTGTWPFDTGATYYIAGLAYGVHVNDIRSDLPNTQTISTFWMDVQEGGGAENLNPYYLATKFGGFTPSTPIPDSTSSTPYNMTTALTTGQWNTSGTTIPMNGNHTQGLPDNYFLAGNAGSMVAGLKTAFTSIGNSSHGSSTAVSFSAPNVSTGGTESFAASYNTVGWLGTITASTLTFDSSGNPLASTLWTTDTTLQSQLASTGWDTARHVVTWNAGGVPFRTASLSSAQLTALLPAYSSGPPASTAESNYLNYLRGDQTNEVGSSASGSTASLRARSLLLGDIVNASLLPVTTPLQTFSETNNPGYKDFVTHWTTTTPRPTMVYAGANDGMLHAFLGTSGREQWAYVPSALYQGPNNTPQVDGLAALGNPSFVHHFYVDSTPYAFDIDMNRTFGATATGNAWSTVLIGGLGKGGKSYYAIDVTDPANMTTESAVALKVLWEFTDSTMGYSYGAPVVVKTLKYGWVVALTSGYNNSDGYGYLYIVNPATGALLEKIKTPLPSSGMTQASAFVKDYSDDTADSIYVGDLNGQVWRFDLTMAATSPASTTPAYPVPQLFAVLTDSYSVGQPVTTAPLIEIHPTTRKRYVMVATGKLLATTDVVSTQMQSFYVMLDGTAGVFVPAPLTAITRATLTPEPQANLTSTNTLPASSKGWYTDLGIDSTSGIGWRVIINPQPYNGIASFSSLLTTGDVCNPSGQSRVYALNYATATSVLQPSSLPFFTSQNAVVNIRYAGANGTPEIIIGTTIGTFSQVPATLTSTLGTRLLNWREIPTAQ